MHFFYAVTTFKVTINDEDDFRRYIPLANSALATDYPIYYCQFLLPG